MNSNIIPKSNADVTTLTLRAIAGALAHGAAVGLVHNPAARLIEALHTLAGDPALSDGAGRQQRLDAQLRAMASTQDTLNEAREAARQFCHVGVGILKPRL